MSTDSWPPPPHPAIQHTAEHLSPAFIRVLGTFGFGRVFVKASGMYLWDDQGRRVLDFLAGFGSVNLGHNPPELVARLARALQEDLPNVLHVGPQPLAAELAHELARRVPQLPMVLFANGGGEAVEEALKLARAATGRHTILYSRGAFHGLGLGSLSVMGHQRLRAPFEPLTPECRPVRFGDLDALRAALKATKVAAVLLEPIQAEGGVIMPPAGYLAQALALCRSHGALLVLDEVQTGIGRTGRMFAFEHEDGVIPDLLVLGKALGGSLMPVSCVMTRRELVEKAYGSMKTFDLHGSTFAGNALACRAALETLRLVDEQHLVQRAHAAGARLIQRLRARLGQHPFVRDVRGLGLLVGVELGPRDGGPWDGVMRGAAEAGFREVFGQWLALRLLEGGILAQPATQQWNVIKLEPPLVVLDEQVDLMVDTLVGILEEYQDLRSLMADVALRVGQQALEGWGFR